jgi:putative Mg2+ transporter-C (MgtC) family protein
VPDISLIEVTLRLLFAAVLGGVIGLERQSRHREAGLRTHMLVSLGSALFTLVSAYAWTDWQFSNENGLVIDPTRVAAQIVTGIGFLGAGAIIRHGPSVRGLTTAATLWACAAIGMASGVGYYAPAAIATVAALFVLVPVRFLSRRFEFLKPLHTRHLLVTLEPETPTVRVTTAIEEAGGAVEKFQVHKRAGQTRLTFEVSLTEDTSTSEIADWVTRVDGVSHLEWTD